MNYSYDFRKCFPCSKSVLCVIKYALVGAMDWTSVSYNKGDVRGRIHSLRVDWLLPIHLFITLDPPPSTKVPLD